MAYFADRFLQSQQPILAMPRIRLEISEVKSPGQFYGREISGDDISSAERLEFQKLDQALNEQFQNEQNYAFPYQASQNEVCIGRTLDAKWCRVKVDQIYSGRWGSEAICLLLDYGRMERIAIQWLRKASQCHLIVPYQMKSYCLYGIQAQTMCMKEDLSCQMEPCMIWDESAVEFMISEIKNATKIEGEVKKQEDNQTHVLLYLSNGEVSLNSQLVMLKYAVWRDTQDLEVSTNFVQNDKSLTIEMKLERLQLRKSKLKPRRSTPASSDNEHLKQGNFNQSKRRSDSDISFIANQRPDYDTHREFKVSDSESDSIRSAALSDSRYYKHGRGRGSYKSDEYSLATSCLSETESLVKSILSPLSQVTKPIENYASNSLVDRTSPVVQCTQVRQVAHQSASVGKDSITSPVADTCRQNLPSVSSGSPNISPGSTGFVLVDRLYKIVRSPSSTPTCVSDSELLKTTPPSFSVKKFLTDESSSENAEKSNLFNVKLEKSDLTAIQSIGRGNLTAKKGSNDNSSSSMAASHLQRFLNQPTSDGDWIKSQTSPRKLHDKAEKISPMKASGQGDKKSKSSSAGSIEDSKDELQTRRDNLMSRMKGDRLLGDLSGGSRDISKKVKEDPNKHGVLLHSPMPVKPYFSFDDAPLAPPIKKIVKDFDFPMPSLIQMYGWPVIFRSNDVVGIAPSGAGKTFAYLCPILSELLHPLSYKDLPVGNGPLAVVLVSSWKKALSLYDITRGLLRDNSRPRPLIIYGGGCEHNKFVPLMNGCEILIATPPCLNRVMKSRYTDFKRLCHLVIDDAETVLKEYTKEVQVIMEAFAETYTENIRKSVPHQVIVVGTQWTMAIDSFIQAYMTDPIIIITSRYEAAIYGKVKAVVHMCRSSQRPVRLLQLLSAVLINGSKVIIFTTTVKEVSQLGELLKSDSQCPYLVHHEMDKFTVQSIIGEWKMNMANDNTKVLVCTDECIDMLKIDDANAVIHYDLPQESKSRFGNRLWCMRKYFQDFSSETKETNDKQVLPISHIIMTEKCVNQGRSVKDLLKRLKCEIPRELTALLAGMEQQKDEDKEKDLCKYLKSFGNCRFHSRCPFRHQILPQVDRPNNELLTCGEVKVRVTNVVTASCFFVRVLEHRAPDGRVTDMSSTGMKLCFEIGKWFSETENRVRLTSVCVGNVCALEEDNTFFRVQIQDIKDSNSPGSQSIRVQVLFVDDGRQRDVAVSKLYELPSQLKCEPFQVVEAFVCRLRPMDRDEDWTSNANQFVHSLFENKVLDGRIALSIGNSIWLDPMVQRRHLKEAETVINKMYIRSELLSNGYAVENPKHLEELYSLCNGQIDIPDVNKHIQSTDQAIEVDLLPDLEEYHKVYISACESPSLLFLQRCQLVKQMDAMVDTFNEMLKNVDTSKMKAAEFKIGTVCLGKFTQDDAWYRVKILECLTDQSFKVLYADLGDTEVLPVTRLHPIPSEYTELPFLAIECQLAHVKPKGENWEENCGDALWDMSHTVAGGNKNLMAKVIGKTESEFAGAHKFEVELWDTYTANDVNLGQELVWSGLASPKEKSNIQELFPLPPIIKWKMYKSPVQKIIDLCACIYWGKDQKRGIPPHAEILEIVARSVVNSPLDLVGYRGIAPVIKLIGRLVDSDVHKCLLESLHVASERSDRLSEEIVNQDGDHSVIQCLDQKSRPGIQKQAVVAIERFIRANDRFVNAFSDASVLEVLCEILEIAEDSEMIGGTAQALACICRKSKSASEIVYHYKICDLITKCLNQTESLAATEAVFSLLIALVEKNGKQDSLHGENLTRAVVSKMDRFYESEECLMCGVRFCENMSKDSRRKKTLLLELGVVIILNKVLVLKLSCTNNEKCRALRDSMVVKVPKSEPIRNQPIDPNIPDYQNRSSPTIQWCQNKWRIVLSIKVNGIRETDSPVRLTTTGLEFRASVKGIKYEASYELYGQIVPGDCHVVIKRQDVRVSLKKVEMGRWPRLLRQKVKHTNIQLDFEQFADSSSENDIPDDDPFLLKKRKIKKLPKDLKRPKGFTVELGEFDVGDLEGSDDTEDDSEEEDNRFRQKVGEDYDEYDVFGMAS